MGDEEIKLKYKKKQLNKMFVYACSFDFLTDVAKIFKQSLEVCLHEIK